MADFENVETFDTVISLMTTENEEARNFLIRYEITQIDQEAADEYEAGEEAPDDDDIMDDEESEPDFLPLASIVIRELSEYDTGLLSDDLAANIQLGKEVCSLQGWLIMGKLIESYGYDPHMICDDFSADLEYAWSALHDESMSAASMFDTLKNIFYVDSINITPEYDNEDFKGNYLAGILGNLIKIVKDNLDDAVEDGVVNKRWTYDIEHDFYIDIISYFPSPLPFDNSDRQKQTDIACGIVSQIRGAMVEKLLNPEAAKQEPEVEIKVAPELYLRAAGMRVSGDTYPEEAKNRAEWDLLEAAGWYECGNSRLLYMTALDCQDDEEEE